MLRLLKSPHRWNYHVLAPNPPSKIMPKVDFGYGFDGVKLRSADNGGHFAGSIDWRTTDA